MSNLHRRFALIRRYVLGVLLMVSLFFAQGTPTQAAMVQFDGARVSGIRGLTVGPQTYNIVFATGPWASLHPGGGLFADASEIAVAIRDELNLITPFPVISSIGIELPLTRFSIPRAPFSSVFFFVSTGTCGTFPNDFCDGPWTTGTGSALITGNIFYAVPSPVPIPAALPLFGSALAMLGLVGWRRKRRAAG